MTREHVTISFTNSTEVQGYPQHIFSSEDLESGKYLCNICNLGLNNPVQGVCGHRFCKQCYEAHTRMKNVQCPACCKDTFLEDDERYAQLTETYPDNAMRREMNKLNVICCYTTCTWSGFFKDLNDHVAVCNKRPVECTVCRQNVTQEQMCEHEKIHSIEGTLCKFNCGQQVQDSNTKEHHTEYIVEHFSAVFTYLERLSQIVGLNLNSSPSIAKSLTQRITELESRLSRNHINRSHKSKAVDSQAATALISADRLEERQQAAVNSPSSAAAASANGPQTEEKIKIFEDVITILNREIEATVSDLDKHGNCLKAMQESLEASERKTKSLERQLAIKDAAMSELQQRMNALEMTSYDGTLTWKITDFNKKRQEAISGRTPSFYSIPFYTSKTGYKMCMRIYLNGDGMGKGSHVSLFFVVMRGQFDAMLQWPFSQKVTLMFLDHNNRDHVVDAFRPDPTSSSFKRPVSEMNIASGCPLFLSLSQLDNTNNAYVKDDTAFLKVIVSPQES